MALAGTGRLGAASCITTTPLWRSEGAAIARATAGLPAFELGLHFNLSEGRPLSPALARAWPTLPALGPLMALAFLGRLPLAAIAAEFEAQIEAFVAEVGSLPAFIDGHQHVHQLPGVREPIVAALKAAPFGPVPPAVRNTGTVTGPGHAWKRAVIRRCGGGALQQLLEVNAIRHNAALLGVYDFRDPDYRGLVRGWLQAAPASGGLVFCHPGRTPAAAGDRLGEARRREAAYLASPAFEQDLLAAGVSLGPAWPQSSSAG